MNSWHEEILEKVHLEWLPILQEALNALDKNYLQMLCESSTWLPGTTSILAAFKMPLSNVKYVLFCESPYPRSQSANGYAFWDASVGSLWSEKGFSREINRATSLRNMMKMFLHARGDLTTSFSQESIAKLKHRDYCRTASELFGGLVNRGFLLLNASLVYEEKKIPYHAKMWRPFLCVVLKHLAQVSPQLLLFGRIAECIPECERFDCLIAEHPYNLSFITNPKVVNFFKPLDVLAYHE
jgi:uracil-DNA glycosylase